MVVVVVDACAGELRGIFEKYQVDALKFLLKLAGTPCSTKKADLIDQLVNDVFGRNLKKTWKLLSRLEQLAMAEAIYNTKGVILHDQIKAKYGETLPWGESYLSVWSSENIPKIRLFFYKQDTLPPLLMEKLKAFVPMPPKNVLHYLESGPSTFNLRLAGNKGGLTFYNASQTVFHDLLSVLSLIDKEKLPDISARAFKTVREVKQEIMPPEEAMVFTTSAISRILTQPDYYADAASSKSIRGFAWFALLKSAGLIAFKKGIIELTSAGKSLQKKQTADAATIKMLFEAFLCCAEFDEITRLDALSTGGYGGYYYWSQSYHQTVFTAPSARRSIVCKTLQVCDYGQWISMSEFCRYLRTQDPPYRTIQTLRELRIGDKKIDSSHLSEAWPALEGSTIKCFFMEYLATLGLLEINYHQPVFDQESQDKAKVSKFLESIDFVSAYDGLYEFRITELGAYCLGITKEVPKASKKQKQSLQITPLLEITVIADQLSPSDIMMLDHCADKVDDKTWQLSISKLLGAVEERSALLSAFPSFLSARVLDMPKTATDFFEDMKRRTCQIAYGEKVNVYACKDRTLAQLIARDTKTKQLCCLGNDSPVDTQKEGSMKDQSGPYLVVPQRVDKQFRTSLKNVGYIAKGAS